MSLTRPRLAALLVLLAVGVLVVLTRGASDPRCPDRGEHATAGRGAGGCEDPNDLDIGSVPGNRDGTPGTLRTKP